MREVYPFRDGIEMRFMFDHIVDRIMLGESDIGAVDAFVGIRRQLINKKVERDEDCDPSNTLCTTATKEPGICTEKCKCVLPEELGSEEKPKEEANVTANVTENAENVTVNVTEENVTAPVEAAKPGFFDRLLEWLASWFR